MNGAAKLDTVAGFVIETKKQPFLRILAWRLLPICDDKANMVHPTLLIALDDEADLCFRAASNSVVQNEAEQFPDEGLVTADMP